MHRKSLNNLWKKEKCPVVNGVIFANGVIKKLEPKEVHQNVEVPEYTGDITIENLGEECGLTDLYKCMKIDLEELNLRVWCGETSWGSEGFIAVSDYTDDNLIWISCLDYSNPIQKVEFLDGKIYATSNLGYLWIYDINNPENVLVEWNKKN